MISDAKRAANKRWDEKNKDRYTVLGCKVKAEDAELYHAAAKAQHTTINAVLKKALDELLKESGNE